MIGYQPEMKIFSSVQNCFFPCVVGSRTGNVTSAPAFGLTLNIEMSDLGKLHMLVPRFSGREHIVNRALGGKNRGIYPRINLCLLEASGCFWRP